jgi:hypothetical protein
VRDFFDRIHSAFTILCVAAFFINIGLFFFASVYIRSEAGFELEILSLGNMLLLSFVLLREPNQKAE